MSEDTWAHIQDIKNKRERLKNRRQKAQNTNLVKGLHLGNTPVTADVAEVNRKRTASQAHIESISSAISQPKLKKDSSSDSIKDMTSTSEDININNNFDETTQTSIVETNNSVKPFVLPIDVLEGHVLRQIEKAGLTFDLPISVKTILDLITEELGQPPVVQDVEELLQKFSIQKLIILMPASKTDKSTVYEIQSVDHTKVSLFLEDIAKEIEPKDQDENISKKPVQLGNDIENLLGAQTSKERETKKLNEDIHYLLNTPTAKEALTFELFKSQGGSQVQQFCPYGTKQECCKLNVSKGVCRKLHFRKIIQPHTDESLGDCSFLNTCFHVESCKYVHYEIESFVQKRPEREEPVDKMSLAPRTSLNVNTTLYPPQWINCDLRQLDMKVLGKFAVIMADPPWDIHMELPYGTMQDDEMRKLNIPLLQDEGYIFLWVTGRAMELGRECLRLWGYGRCDELIWVKTNQLQRIIRTGRTGHWINHGKEHCLVGVKGDPKNMTKRMDCDVIVSEVRETSHKPDEVYGIIERLAPGMRKLELFGRPHNVQPNWITLGNQLDGTRLVDPEVVERFKKRYPNGLEYNNAKKT